MCTNTPNPFRCLLIEDDPDHAFLVMRALGLGDVPVVVDHLEDGQAALDHLEDLASRPAALPDLVLLDLNLAGLGGHDVLARIKSDRQLRVTPVVVLTTSRADVDRRAAYERHANGYLVKPTEVDGFNRLAQAVADFWGRWNQTAPRGRASGESSSGSVGVATVKGMEPRHD